MLKINEQYNWMTCVFRLLGNGEDDFENEAEEIDLLLTSAPGQHKSKVYHQTVDHKSLWSQWLAFRPRLWAILEKPFSSVYAQVSLSRKVALMSLTSPLFPEVERVIFPHRLKSLII